MKIRFFLSACLFAAIVIPSIAQDRMPQSNLFSNFGASANAGGSNSSDNIGVDLYTGLPSVYLKLFGYDNPARGLNHQVSISYRGGGIRADDMGSNIGTGWALNASYNISRQIRGIPDDDVNNGFRNTGPVPLSFNQTTFSKYLNDVYDAAPDLYSYSAGSYSGQFIIGKNGTVLTMPSSSVKIEFQQYPYNPSANELDSCSGSMFKITTPEGVQYYYSAFNCSRQDYGDTSSSRLHYATTNWYISKIVSAFNTDSIGFSYVPVINKYNNVGVSIDYTLIYDPSISSYFNGDEINITYVQRLRDMQLSAIQYPNGTSVNFVYESFNRLDLNSDQALRQINIRNGNSRYGYQFDYHYNYGSQTKPYQNYTTALEWNHESISRMYLDSVRTFSGADTLPGFTFNYYGGPQPAKFISGTDNWGFSNGSSGRLPYLVFKTSANVVDTIFGNKMEPNLATTLPGSLQKIQLPTGGSQTFDYELNTCKVDTGDRFVGGLRVKRLTTNDNVGQNNQIVREYSYLNVDGSSSGYLANNPIYDFSYQETFTPNPSNHNRPVSAPATGIYEGYDLVGAYMGTNVNDLGIYQYQFRSSTPINDFTYTHGNPVGYSRVIEYLGTSTNNIGTIISEFTTLADYPVPTAYQNNALPYAPAPIADFTTGLLKANYSYTSAGILKQKSVNTYYVPLNYMDYDSYRGIKLALTNFPATAVSSYKFKNYIPVIGRVYPVKTTNTEYYPNNDSLITTNETIYDTLNAVPRYTKTLNAKGDLIINKFYYPFDFNIAGAINTLNAKGIIYSPVRMETWKDSSKILNASINNYTVVGIGQVKQAGTFVLTSIDPIPTGTYGGFNSSQLFPAASNSFTQIASMDKYDDAGNLLQTTKNGMKRVTIWGYNNHLPIATIDNAGITDVAFTSFEQPDALGNWVSNMPTTTTSFFTGKTCAIVSSSSSARCRISDLASGSKYVLTFWAKGSVPGVYRNTNIAMAPVAGETHQGWTFYSVLVTGASDISIVKSFTSGGSYLLDEVRLYPLGSFMTSYTYDKLLGLTTIDDMANRISYTEYDGFGRVILKRDLDGNIISTNDYKNQESQQ